MSQCNLESLVVETAHWHEDKTQLIELRRIVFIEEQRVPSSIEIDGMDPDCRHVKALVQGRYIGTARLLPNGYIGRMCVLKDFRNQGVGSKMLDNLIQQAFFDPTAAGVMDEVSLNSQVSALAFYTRNGFESCSETFMEADIEHQKMTLKKSNYRN